jgi:hypothetical protein
MDSLFSGIQRGQGCWAAVKSGFWQGAQIGGALGALMAGYILISRRRIDYYYWLKKNGRVTLRICAFFIPFFTFVGFATECLK